MTPAENRSTAPREGAAFVFRARGARFFPRAGASLSFASRRAARLVLPGLPPGLLAPGDEVEAEYAGEVVFRGEVAALSERQAGGAEAWADATCLDAWDRLERRVFRQTWRVASASGAEVEASSARVVLNADAAGAPVPLAAQVAEVCSAGGLMMSDGGIPSATLPADEASDITCADALRRLLRLFPKVVARAAPGPAGASVVQFSVPSGRDAAWLSGGRVLSRTKTYRAHPVVGVSISAAASAVSVTDAEGVTRDLRAHLRQEAGDVSSDDCLHVYLPLAGGSASASWESLEVASEEIPDLGDAAFWTRKHPRLANVPASAVTVEESWREPETYGRITSNDVGALRAFGIGAEVSRLSCRATVRTEDDVEERILLTMDFATTDARPGRRTRQTGSSASGAESLPEGLAAALLAQRAGALESEEVEVALGGGCALPRVGDSADGLVCQSVEVDCAACTARASFGHPAHLSAEEMRDLLNGFRRPGWVANAPRRGEGDGDGGGAARPVAGGVMPIAATEFAPGRKAKTTIAGSDGGGSIVLDAAEVGAGEALAVWDVDYGDGTAAKALATGPLEVCWR